MSLARIVRFSAAALLAAAVLPVSAAQAPEPPAAVPVPAAVPAPAPVPVSRTMVPLRQVVEVQGVRDNQLVGYGLVVGLNNTGDGTQARFTVQSIANALQRMGIVIDPIAIRVRNVAAVMVTGTLPGFAQPGTRIDINVASLGDAKSLAGGVLLMTPLKAADGLIYAVGQGPLTVGGAFSAGGGGNTVVKNHPTAGAIPGGALVERSAGVDLSQEAVLTLQVKTPSFGVAQRVQRALETAFGPGSARAVDAGTVRAAVPASMKGDPVEYLARAMELPVEPDIPARVVMNERSGTVVLGGDIKISRVAVSHGDLTVSVSTRYEVSQPAPFSYKGDTKVVPQTDVVAEEGDAKGLVLGEGASVDDLVAALRRIGATPRDMIAILEAMHAAGALHAELVVI